MSSQKTIDDLTSREYKYGFVTDVGADTVPPGLSEDVIRLISSKKDEPEFMLEWRLKAYRHWLTMKEPAWANVHYPPSTIRRSATTRLRRRARAQEPRRGGSRDSQDLREAGIPLQERALLAGVAVDAVFDSVSVATTFKAKLGELGIIFCSFSEAVREHPDLVKKYLGRSSPTRTTTSRRSTRRSSATARSSTSLRASAARWSCRPTSGSTPRTPGSSSGPSSSPTTPRT
jgi:Fe-S cluster assembly protein SufB